MAFHASCLTKCPRQPREVDTILIFIGFRRELPPNTQLVRGRVKLNWSSESKLRALSLSTPRCGWTARKGLGCNNETDLRGKCCPAGWGGGSGRPPLGRDGGTDRTDGGGLPEVRGSVERTHSASALLIPGCFPISFL